MGERRTRELVGVGLALVASVAWVVAMRVPWYSAGLPGSTTALDVAELLGSGVLGVPSVVGWLVLLLPGLALVQLGLSPLRGGRVFAVRLTLWVVCVAAGLVLVVALGGMAAGVVGPGVVVAVLAWVCGGASLCCATVRRPRPHPAGG